jgi:ferredoxin
VGSNLRTEAQKAGIKLYGGFNGVGASLNEVFNCHGFGLCGTCLVKITKGMENTNPMTMMEKMKFRVPVPDPMPAMHYIGNEDTIRMSCKTIVNGDIDVETRPPLNLFGEEFFA